MKQLSRYAIGAALAVAASAAAGHAQTRTMTFVTNSYDLRVQQFSAGSMENGTRYVSFGGEAKAIDNKIAADLKTFAFTLFYNVSDTGTVAVTDGTFLIQTTNKDRSPLTVGGDIQPGATFTVRGTGAIAAGQRLSLSLVGSEGTDIVGVLSASVDKSNPPRLSGTLSLTYPVLQ
jgi:hypothetical protein